MDITRQTLRRAGGLAAAALLAFTLGSVGPNSQSDALGATIAITPNEVNAQFLPPGSPGNVLNPSLSGRGEAAGVTEAQTSEIGWAFLDTAGQEHMSSGLGITVSGNGCMSLSVFQEFPIILFAPAARQTNDFVWLVNDRCRNIVNREVFRSPGLTTYDLNNQMALSFTGRFAVIIVPTDQFSASRMVRVDTESLAFADMPLPPDGFNWEGYLGVDISDNGNVVVAAAERTVDDLRTTDVAAWDVPSGGVTLVAGGGSDGATGYGSVSGDGRFVSLTSSRPLTGAESGLGPWTYVVDRANGSARLVSAADGFTYGTSLSRDASQVAFAVGPTGCQYSPRFLDGLGTSACTGLRIDVAFGPTSGFTAPFSTETVSIGLNGSPAAGRHMQPFLSGNGRWVAWISDAGRALVSPNVTGLQAFTRRRDPGLVVDPLDFGTIAINSTSTLPATVRNTGRTSVSLDSITAAPGVFTIQGGGTCAGGSLLPPGATCTVNIRYAAPNIATQSNGSITVAEVGFDRISAVGRLTGASAVAPPPTTTTTTLAPTTTSVGQVPPGRTTTTTSTTAPPGHVSLTADPNPVDFGQVSVGLGSPIHTVTITNIGDGSGQMLTELGGANPDDFFVVSNGCNELVIAPGQSCTMQIMMIPLAGGLRQASLILTAGGLSGDIAMFGDGHFAPLLVASPEAITDNGATTIIGQGFPPNQTFDVHVDPTSLVITATSDATGLFQIPLSAVPNLSLGNFILRVDPVPEVFDLVQGQLVVVLGTFEPQGPGSAAFGDAIIVTRGG
jgi:hypothetical protein